MTSFLLSPSLVAIAVSVSAASFAAFSLGAQDAAAADGKAFNRIASWPVAENLPQGADASSETSAEIIAASDDGMTIVYSDSPLKVVGFVDINDPAAPKGAGTVDVGGEPTSVAVHANAVLAAVNTSDSYTDPSGKLLTISLSDRTIGVTCALGGQPDSIAISPDGSLIAVAIENERDEDLDDGKMPQLPAGNLTLYKATDGVPSCDEKTVVDLTGLADVAPSDPEPEFVAFNGDGHVAVTLQENNHIAIVDGATGSVVSHFSAGTVDLEGVDTKEDGAITPTDSLSAVKREPDAVKWLGNDRLVTANEGDYEGGARGFTIFATDGSVLYESGAAFEHEVIRAGHYPDERSENKGAEPEGLEVGTFEGTDYIFVLSERGSVVGVYRDTGEAPQFAQLLPSGIGPEGAVAIGARNLLVTANEADLSGDGGPRAHIMIYELQDGAPQYPQIVSVDGEDGKPIGWGALSGLAADPVSPGVLYAVSDSFYAGAPTIFTIDTSGTPARITEHVIVNDDGEAAQKLDLEGIASDGEGGFWLASEGRTDRDIPHRLLKVNAAGTIESEVDLPEELLAHETRFGAEGIAAVGSGDTLRLFIAMQRPWADDPDGEVKIVVYAPQDGRWEGMRYPLDKGDKGWVGLSEITFHNDTLYVIERDNQIGDNAKIKRLYKIGMDGVAPAPLGGDLPLVDKTLVRDFLPDLKSLNGFVVDKIEGFTIDADGNAFAVTDNDGVDDSSGETLFLRLGKL
ncbi:MAG: esterase-like activity of phytase family protein [Pseudomonadota bacterium]